MAKCLDSVSYVQFVSHLAFAALDNSGMSQACQLKLLLYQLQILDSILSGAASYLVC